MRQDSIRHSNPPNRFPGLQWTVGLILLLSLRMSLQAQSGICRPPDPEEHGAISVEPPTGDGVSTADSRLGSDIELTPASEADGTFSATETSTAAPGVSPSEASIVSWNGTTHCSDWFFPSSQGWQAVTQDAAGKSGSATPDGGSTPSSVVLVRKSLPIDSDHKFFFKNKFEFSLEGGWFPVNIPFVFDVFLGDAYNMTSLKYTLAPIIASVRWQVNNADGPWIFRGNWDLEASGAAVVIPRGPETHYFAFLLGFRRNFVPRRGRFAPYFDGRLGMGEINAKEPQGVLYAQGQNFTFTMNMGSGVRYNFSPRYAIWTGLNWMHISNLYLSQPQFANYGINVYGPMFGIDVRLGKFHDNTPR